MSDFEPRIRRALGDLAAAASADAREADLWERTQGRITRRRRRARGALAGLAVISVLVPALGIPALTRDDDPRRVVAGPGEGRVDPSMPRRIAAVTTDGRLLVLDSATGEVEDELESSFPGVEYTFVSAAPNGTTLFLGGEDRGDGLIYRRGLASGEEAWVASGTWPSVSPDGRLLAYVTSGTDTGYVGYTELRVIDLHTRAERTWPLDPDDPTARIVAPPRWSPDGSHLAIGAITENGGLLLFDVDSDTYVGQAQAARPAHYIDSIVDYLGRTGELLGVSEVDTEGGSRETRAKPQRVVAMDASTGEVTRDLFELNLIHGPLVTAPDLLADPTGRHVLAVDVQGKLHRWSEGEDGATELAKGIVAATWIPDPPPPEETTTTSTTMPETTDDAWQMLPDAPIAGRRDAAAVWTGTEMIVWGGEGEDYEWLGDGAAYDPATRTWRKIAPAPIAGRAGPAAVWTGTEMIVWGGAVESGRDRATGDMTFAADGAAYDPVADEWREIAEAPIITGWGLKAVWNGFEMFVGGPDPESSEYRLAAYDPSRDPSGDPWRTVPVPDDGSPTRAVWTGAELLMWTGDGTLVRGHALGEDGSWRRLADPPPTEPAIDPPSYIFPFVPLAWTGEVVVGKRAYDTQVYDPATDTYVEGEGGWGWGGGAEAWTGRVVLDWGGSDLEGDSYHADGTLYAPVSDTATPLPPSPLEGRQSPAAVWTGSEMLVWGGFRGSSAGTSPDTWFADGAAYRPPAAVVPVQGDAADPPATIIAVVAGDVVEMDASDGSVLRTIVAADEEVHATLVLVDRPRGRVFLLGDGGCDGEGNETVWQVPIGGGSDPVRVTEAFEPSVSPDGEWLAAPRHEDGCAAGALVLHEIESGGERIWRDAPGEYRHAEWAPDGRRLAVGVYAGGGGAPDGEIRVLDTQNRYAAYSDMPVLARGDLTDSVVVDGRWVLAVVVRCDREVDRECRDEVVTVDGETGERIDSFGEWLRTQDVDLDATGRHALVFAPDETEGSAGGTVMYAVEPGGESRRIGPATDADW